MRARRTTITTPASTPKSSSVDQISIFRSPAARRLGFIGSVVGAGYGAFAGVGMSFFTQSDGLVKNTVVGTAMGSITLGAAGFFTGAAAAATARTRLVKTAMAATTDTIRKLWK